MDRLQLAERHRADSRDGMLTDKLVIALERLGGDVMLAIGEPGLEIGGDSHLRRFEEGILFLPGLHPGEIDQRIALAPTDTLRPSEALAGRGVAAELDANLPAIAPPVANNAVAARAAPLFSRS